jgi:hypothetical protein
MFKQFSHQLKKKLKKKKLIRWALTKILHTHTELTNHNAQGYGYNRWVMLMWSWWWSLNASQKRWCNGTIWYGCQPNKILWIIVK